MGLVWLLVHIRIAQLLPCCGRPMLPSGTLPPLLASVPVSLGQLPPSFLTVLLEGGVFPTPGQIQHCLTLATTQGGPPLTQVRLTGFRISDGIIRFSSPEMPWWENATKRRLHDKHLLYGRKPSKDMTSIQNAFLKASKLTSRQTNSIPRDI